MANGDYRSRGVHTNRDKTSKMRVNPIDRLGGPFKPPTRTVVDAAGDIVARGNKRVNQVADTINPPQSKPKPQVGPTKKAAAKMNEDKAAARRKRVGSTLMSAGGDMQQKAAADAEQFSREHDEAVRAGAGEMARKQMATPGRAQEIIRKRRI